MLIKSVDFTKQGILAKKLKITLQSFIFPVTMINIHS